MTGSDTQPQTSVPGKLPEKARKDLHRALDRLLDQRDELAEQMARPASHDEDVDSLQIRSRGLVKQAVRLAARAAGERSRELAFHHPDCESRAAFSNFLLTVADFAASEKIAEGPHGLTAFSFADVVRRYDDMRSLDHGHTPPRLRPAALSGPRRTSYQLLKEQFRATQWVSYLNGKSPMESAVKAVSQAYGVSDKTIYNWRKTAMTDVSYDARYILLENAREAGQSGKRPSFTLKPWQPNREESIATWLAHDASHYKKLSASMT